MDEGWPELDPFTATKDFVIVERAKLLELAARLAAVWHIEEVRAVGIELSKLAEEA